ncbi:Regulator of G protein signaling [Achlya hypogyna]|uniref:Regulator of G protein signaling n=1 Tax=Achlya hypogyna TaxID=1202772 RepID=A0A1V9Y5A6_ACHHY|nr:Regulator of G protein signaling [Achlya hypogyna]
MGGSASVAQDFHAVEEQPRNEKETATKIRPRLIQMEKDTSYRPNPVSEANGKEVEAEDEVGCLRPKKDLYTPLTPSLYYESRSPQLRSLSYDKLPRTADEVKRSTAAGGLQLRTVDHTKYRRASMAVTLANEMTMAFTMDVLFNPVTFKLMVSYCHSIPFASDRLLFWADVQHLRTLPSAAYTDRMLQKIYQKFVSPQAATPICVPTNVLREIQKTCETPAGIQSAGLLGGRGLASCERVYAEAQALCLRDLKKDVFPRFRKHKLFQSMVTACEKQPPAKRSSRFSCMQETPTLPLFQYDSTYGFEAVMADKWKLRYFKSYCIENMSSENLLFYLEVDECKRLPNQSFVQATARKIYDTYLKPGAKRYLNLSLRLHNEFQIPNDASFEPSSFFDAQYLVLEYIRVELWPRFSVSDAYIKYCQNEAESPQPWDDYHPEISAEQMETLMSELDAISPLIQRGLSIPVEAIANAPKPVNPNTLMLLLHDKLGHRAFTKFLSLKGNAHYVTFIDEVDEYEGLPGIEFMQHMAKKLYKKYLSESSKLQVDMSTKMRQDIEAKLVSPTTDMFKVIVARVKQGLLRDALRRYLKSPIYLELNLAAINPELAKELDVAVAKGKLEIPHLEIFLSDAAFLSNFKSYCKSQHCVENLLFWEEVEEFRRLPSNQIVSRSAKKIVDKYINIETSKTPIALPEHLHDFLTDNLERVDRAYFHDAVAEVMETLRSVELPEFLDSPMFMILVGSWVTMDQVYAVHHLHSDLESAYFRHRFHYICEAKKEKGLDDALS